MSAREKGGSGAQELREFRQAKRGRREDMGRIEIAAPAGSQALVSRRAVGLPVSVLSIPRERGPAPETFAGKMGKMKRKIDSGPWARNLRKAALRPSNRSLPILLVCSG